MPKDEFDFDDPMELNGVTLFTEEDTTDLMCTCFIEEFLRLGYNQKQVLALFRNPHYLGMHLVLDRRGEPYVRDRIREVFTQWGRSESNPNEHPIPLPTPGGPQPPPSDAPIEPAWEPGVSDPTGGAIPKITL